MEICFAVGFIFGFALIAAVSVIFNFWLRKSSAKVAESITQELLYIHSKIQSIEKAILSQVTKV